MNRTTVTLPARAVRLMPFTGTTARPVTPRRLLRTIVMAGTTPDS